MTPNLDHLFNKEFYRVFSHQEWQSLATDENPILGTASKDHIEKINTAITRANILNYAAETQTLVDSSPGCRYFCLETTYPGLMTGVGEIHSAEKIDDEFRLGFHFDYTTGLPIIPGSTVKGVLRSVFKKTDYLGEILTELGITMMDIFALEKEIFDGEKNGEPLSIYQRDIFYDACIVKSENSEGVFLGPDAITPHGANPLKNPTPIKFLKILPGVRFRFQFNLKDGIIFADKKLALFERILLDVGIGAKTNVGYGHLSKPTLTPEEKQRQIELENEIIAKAKEEKEKEREQYLASLSPVDRIIEKHNSETTTIIQALEANTEDLSHSEKIELAKRIKAIMKEQNLWKPKKKNKKQVQRVNFIKQILGV